MNDKDLAQALAPLCASTYSGASCLVPFLGKLATAMSTTTAPIDAVANLNGWLQTLSHFFTADIKAIPEDKLTWSPGGCARSAASIAHEVIGLCSWMAAALKGESANENYMDDSNASSNHNQIIADLATATGALSNALVSADAETLNKTVTPPWKMDCPMYMCAQIVVSHIWYHDGQLNTIQCLLGDDKVHWMGD